MVSLLRGVLEALSTIVFSGKEWDESTTISFSTFSVGLLGTLSLSFSAACLGAVCWEVSISFDSMSDARIEECFWFFIDSGRTSRSTDLELLTCSTFLAMFLFDNLSDSKRATSSCNADKRRLALKGDSGDGTISRDDAACLLARPGDSGEDVGCFFTFSNEDCA